MAKHLDKFTQPFRDSPIPFALAEILTNGSGEMVDLVCRFLNPAAAALLGLSPEDVQGRRLSQLGPERALEQLAPMQAVAFSGSSASFPYVTAGGQTLTVTCYQVMYGTVACLLDPRSGAGAQSGALPELLPGADLELNREGLRCLACSRQLCQPGGRCWTGAAGPFPLWWLRRTGRRCSRNCWTRRGRNGAWITTSACCGGTVGQSG